jgi:hypothetical protein
MTPGRAPTGIVRTRDVERSADTVRRRGRPAKFGRPGRVVALTLPEDAIRELHRVHHDIGWAIVKLLEAAHPVAVAATREEQPDVELVEVGERRALIVINLEVFRLLPGVNIMPFGGNRAFLALDTGRGMSDLELAVIDRLGDPAIESRERRALMTLRTQLTTWRRDRNVQFHTRAIIVIERLNHQPPAEHGNRAGSALRRQAASRPALTPSRPRDTKKTSASVVRGEVMRPGPTRPGRRRWDVAS